MQRGGVAQLSHMTSRCQESGGLGLYRWPGWVSVRGASRVLGHYLVVRHRGCESQVEAAVLGAMGWK